MPLTKFLDPLPIPFVLQPKDKDKNGTYYEVSMTQFTQSLHSEMNDTTVWGYENSYPGPTFEITRGERVQVKWINELPSKHLLPVDKTVHGADPENPEVRTVVHVHGASVPPESDGYPEAWFTRGFEQVGPYFVHEVYEYPNQQRGATLWYHDHALGITRLNVYAGLAGFYLIREPFERFLNFPNGDYEIPLLIQDRSFNPDGSLYYPVPNIGGVQPSIVPEFFGDTILVNGKVWPHLEVEPRKYRFRILNGSNSRFYRLKLDSGQPFYQIGTDGGLLERTVRTREILLGPAERADVIVDFSHHFGQNILLTNEAPTPFPDGTPPDESTGVVMQFRVNLTLTGRDTSTIPRLLHPILWLPEIMAKNTRHLTLVEDTDRYGRLKLLLDGRAWDQPVTENPHLGDIEIWNLINLTPDTHPIHLHLVQLQILDRQPFNVEHYNTTGEIIYTGLSNPPASEERGWKDTVRANPGEVTRVITRFSPYTGLYVWHCHILEHEDYEMMRPYEVLSPYTDNPLHWLWKLIVSLARLAENKSMDD